MIISNLKSSLNKFIQLEFLLILWFVTLPFGSKLASVSLSFFTLYPNLIVTGIICLFTFKSIKKWNKFAFLLTSFFLLWFSYSVIFALKYGLTEEAIFDVRALLMQFLFFLVFINAFYLIEKEKYFSILKMGVRIYLYTLILFGIFEFFTGNHFEGKSTEMFHDIPITSIFYAPLFLYDNANDYLLYLLFFLELNIILDSDLQKNVFKKLSFYLIALVFSIYAESVLSKSLVISLIILDIILFIWAKRKELAKEFIIYLSVCLCLILVLFQNQLFYGPLYKNGKDYRINGLKSISKENGSYKIVDVKKEYSKKEQTEIINFLDSLERNNPKSSSNERKNLILNGLDFIKEKPILGIGPGNYKIRHNQKQVKRFTHTINSAHNFPIEIISQFGIFAWIYFGLFAWLFYKFLVLRIKHKVKTVNWVFVLFLSCPIFWIIPSAYLYLDVNWILLPLLSTVYFSNKNSLIKEENG